jgi:hypothetical protein
MHLASTLFGLHLELLIICVRLIKQVSRGIRFGQSPDVFPNLCLRGKWLGQRIASRAYGWKLNHEGVPGIQPRARYY